MKVGWESAGKLGLQERETGGTSHLKREHNVGEKGEMRRRILDHTEGKSIAGERKKKNQMPGKQKFDFLERKYEKEYVNSS